MELFYFVLFSIFSNVLCQSCTCDRSKDIIMEKYQVFLIGFAMLLMFIAIICLSLALYMVKCNKTILGFSIQKLNYMRQESGHGVTKCHYTNTANDVHNNDGSTLTVNSGIVEVGGLDEPQTPTRVELRDEKKPSYLKKPIVPLLNKAQMDGIIRQLIESNRHERGEEVNLKEVEDFIVPKFPKRNAYAPGHKRISASLNDLDVTNEDISDDLYENLPKNKQESIVGKTTNLIETNDAERLCDLNIQVENEQEVYDTLPNPVRCTQTSIDDGYVENIPVYDCPPRKSWEKRESNRSQIILDQDTDYLLLISKSKNEDDTSYINAKTCNTLKNNQRNT